MKFRRAIVTAAATAVIAPLALLSAPVAFATDETSAASTSTPADEETTAPADTGTPPADDQATPGDDQTTPADDETTPADDQTTPADDQTTPGDDQTTPGDDQTTPADDETTEPATPAPTETEPEDDPELCVDEDGNDTTGLSTELSSGLSGLPDTIVAGSGWTGFSFNISNGSDDEIKDITPLIGVAALGWDDGKDYSGQITVQVFDEASGSWKTLADTAGEGGTLDTFSLDAGRSVSYKLRLSVSGKVPDSIAVTGGFAEYADDEGCWIADDPNGWLYYFDVLAAGSDAGDPNEAKPQGGKTDLTEVSAVAASGTLAETGSSSALPMIGLVGGVAVVAGAGAVFVVRRRKAGAEA